MRSLIERATRDFVFKRRFSANFGGVPILVTPSAGLRFLTRSLPAIDPTLLNLAEELVKPGDVVWDIGANIGFFSFPAAHRAGPGGRVFAIEPDTWLVQLLRKSAKMQPSSSAPVTILQSAVASSIGLRAFCLAARARSANFLDGYGTTQTGGQIDKLDVITLTLDSLLGPLPPPNLLKIDTEGAELEVLLGAKSLLGVHQPTILCEVGGERSADVMNLLHSCGYEVFDGDTLVHSRRPLAHAPWNTLALPKLRQCPATS